MSKQMQVGPELNKLVHYKLFGVKLQLAPRYSTDWNAMRLVVEEMQRRGHEIVMQYFDAMQGWRWVVRFNQSSKYTHADTAPHAVCLAALQALEADTHA